MAKLYNIKCDLSREKLSKCNASVNGGHLSFPDLFLSSPNVLIGDPDKTLFSSWIPAFAGMTP